MRKEPVVSTREKSTVQSIEGYNLHQYSSMFQMLVRGNYQLCGSDVQAQQVYVTYALIVLSRGT